MKDLVAEALVRLPQKYRLIFIITGAVLIHLSLGTYHTFGNIFKMCNFLFSAKNQFWDGILKMALFDNAQQNISKWDILIKDISGHNILRRKYFSKRNFTTNFENNIRCCLKSAILKGIILKCSLLSDIVMFCLFQTVNKKYLKLILIFL